MGLLYTILKIYPAFGISIALVSYDLFRNFRRKGSKVWIPMLGILIFSVVSTVLWLIFRGDKNAEIWYQAVVNTFRD
jgi:hypothetical protein